MEEWYAKSLIFGASDTLIWEEIYRQCRMYTGKSGPQSESSRNKDGPSHRKYVPTDLSGRYLTSESPVHCTPPGTAVHLHFWSYTLTLAHLDDVHTTYVAAVHTATVVSVTDWYIPPQVVSLPFLINPAPSLITSWGSIPVSIHPWPPGGIALSVMRSAISFLRSFSIPTPPRRARQSSVTSFGGSGLSAVRV